MKIAKQQNRTLHSQGYWVDFPREAIRLVGDIFTKRVTTRFNCETGVACVEARESLLTGMDADSPCDASAPILPNRGMLYVFYLIAMWMGIAYRPITRSPVTQLPAPSNIELLTYPAVASFVKDTGLGLIRVANQANRGDVLADIVTAFEGKRVAILGTKIEFLRRTEAHLRRTLPGRMGSNVPPILLAHSRRRPPVRDGHSKPYVLLCTPSGTDGYHVETCDILVFLDARDALNFDAQYPLVRTFTQCPLFALHGLGDDYAPYDLDRIRRTFGFMQIDLHTNGRVRRPVSYALVRNNISPPIHRGVQNACNGQNTSSRWPMGNPCVHDPAHNDRIKRIAAKIAHGDVLNPKNHRDLRRALGGRHGEPLNVAVLVDGLEHAETLGQRLSQWPILTGEQLPPGYTLGQLEGATNALEARPQLGPYQIVTRQGAKKYGADNIDVVIWASAGKPKGHIPGDWLFSRHSADRPLIIVDFYHAYDREARQRSIHRIKELESRGIFRAGVAPELGLIERFLREHGINLRSKKR